MDYSGVLPSPQISLEPILDADLFKHKCAIRSVIDESRINYWEPGLKPMDKVTIVINCDNHTVKIEPHPVHLKTADTSVVDNSRAEIIARIVSPQIRNLMAMPVGALNEKYLDLLAGKS